MDLTLSLWKTLEIYFRIVITPVTVDENTKLCKYETKKNCAMHQLPMKPLLNNCKVSLKYIDKNVYEYCQFRNRF